MDNGSLSSNEKISEALSLLEQAAREKKNELQNLVTDKYHNLKDVLSGVEGDVSKAISAARKRAIEAAMHVREVGGEKVKKVAADVDHQVHENPWPYIGGVALGALLIGYILGRNR